jgi:hypothetical protein
MNFVDSKWKRVNGEDHGNQARVGAYYQQHVCKTFETKMCNKSATNLTSYNKPNEHR